MGYVQCDNEVPEQLQNKYTDFPPFFNNIIGRKIDIGDLMKNFAEEEGLLTPTRKKLISSFSLKNGTLITPLLLFYLELGLVCTKLYRFVEYIPKKRFNNFIQSGVDTRRQGDEIPNSSVVAETMKLIAKNSYGYQIMDSSQHTVTKYLSDEKRMKPSTIKCLNASVL